jgi:phosphate starvation-inducible PhoH-like protein
VNLKKLVITRPAVEAGENLGFLPGSLEDKMNPFLQPIYDAFGETVNHGLISSWTANKVIETVPIAYMRGRTFKNTFIVCDESQNLNISQLTMILTRLGEGSKLVINGDSEQSDLPKSRQGGLDKCIERLDGIDGIEVVEFTKKDSVRHPLIEKMLSALAD